MGVHLPGCLEARFDRSGRKDVLNQLLFKVHGAVCHSPLALKGNTVR